MGLRARLRVTISNGSWVKSGQFPRLEPYHLIIRKNLTNWWIVSTNRTISGGLSLEGDNNMEYKLYETFYGCYLRYGGKNIFLHIFIDLKWSHVTEKK